MRCTITSASQRRPGDVIDPRPRYPASAPPQDPIHPFSNPLSSTTHHTWRCRRPPGGDSRGRCAAHGRRARRPESARAARAGTSSTPRRRRRARVIARRCCRPARSARCRRRCARSAPARRRGGSGRGAGTGSPAPGSSWLRRREGQRQRPGRAGESGCGAGRDAPACSDDAMLASRPLAELEPGVARPGAAPRPWRGALLLSRARQRAAPRGATRQRAGGRRGLAPAPHQRRGVRRPARRARCPLRSARVEGRDILCGAGGRVG